eukprot:284549_1
MSNSVKFCKNDSTLTVEMKMEEVEGQKSIKFAVCDKVIGIPYESIGKVFLPFQQADNSTTREYGGTGLGLPICVYLSTILQEPDECKDLMREICLEPTVRKSLLVMTIVRDTNDDDVRSMLKYQQSDISYQKPVKRIKTTRSIARLSAVSWTHWACNSSLRRPVVKPWTRSRRRLTSDWCSWIVSWRITCISINTKNSPAFPTAF